MALSEWGLTPEYINTNWTEELLALMVQKRNQRVRGTSGSDGRESNGSRMSNSDFFAKHNIKVKEL